MFPLLRQHREHAVHLLESGRIIVGTNVSAHFQVLQDGEGWENVIGLWYVTHSQAYDFVRAHARDVDSLQIDRSGCGFEQPEDGFDKSGFACAIGTEQGDHLALLQSDGNAVQYLHLAVSGPYEISLEYAQTRPPRYASSTRGSLFISSGVP